MFLVREIENAVKRKSVRKQAAGHGIPDTRLAAVLNNESTVPLDRRVTLVQYPDGSSRVGDTETGRTYIIKED